MQTDHPLMDDMFGGFFKPNAPGDAIVVIKELPHFVF